MRFLFLISDGLILLILSIFIKKKSIPSLLYESFAMLPKISDAKVEIIKTEIFKMKMNERSLNGDNDVNIKLLNGDINFDYYRNKKVVRLDINQDDLISNYEITKFITSIDWLSYVTKYTKTKMIFLGINSWITLPVPKLNENYEMQSQYEDTQIWHRDVDNLRDIKIMIYLTDVLIESEGPFEIIKNTHYFRFFNPLNYINKVNFRVTDKLVKNKYRNELFSFYGNKGTNFLVDTRALHRGKTILKKDFYRVILQLYFSNHLFGKSKKINFNSQWNSAKLWKEMLSKNREKYQSLFNF
jgi:hypothetical protein